MYLSGDDSTPARLYFNTINKIELFVMCRCETEKNQLILMYMYVLDRYFQE